MTDEERRTRLSPRERQLVRLAAAGRTDKEICRELGVALPTVRTHWTRLREKLEVTTRTQAVAAALRQGQVERLTTGAARLLEGVDLSGIGFWLWDSATNEVRLDEECRLLYGISSEGSLTINDLLTHVPPPERGEMLALLQRVKAGNPPAPLTHRADPSRRYATCLRTTALAPAETESTIVLLASVRWQAFAA